MKLNLKKIAAAACMAAFLATSFIPETSEAAGRMSLAQAQQEVKRPLHQKYPHYKVKHSHKKAPAHRVKLSHKRVVKHRPAMHTRGPVSQTWGPVHHSPHKLKYHKPVGKKWAPRVKPHGPVRPVKPAPHHHPAR